MRSGNDNSQTQPHLFYLCAVNVGGLIQQKSSGFTVRGTGFKSQLCHLLSISCILCEQPGLLNSTLAGLFGESNKAWMFRNFVNLAMLWKGML